MLSHNNIHRTYLHNNMPINRVNPNILRPRRQKPLQLLPQRLNITRNFLDTRDLQIPATFAFMVDRQELRGRAANAVEFGVWGAVC